MLFSSATMAPSPDSFVLRQQKPPFSSDSDLPALVFSSVVSFIFIILSTMFNQLTNYLLLRTFNNLAHEDVEMHLGRIYFCAFEIIFLLLSRQMIIVMNCANLIWFLCCDVRSQQCCLSRLYNLYKLVTFSFRNVNK